MFVEPVERPENRSTHRLSLVGVTRGGTKQTSGVSGNLTDLVSLLPGCLTDLVDYPNQPIIWASERAKLSPDLIKTDDTIITLIPVVQTP